MITTQGGIDPDAPGLSGRIGGPLGKHAVRAGVWFDPVPWSLGAGVVAWLLCMFRQVRCLTSDPGHTVNPFAALCYSDLTSLYQSRENFWSGAPLYGGAQPLEYPPLSGGFIWVARWLTAHLGQVVSPVADAAQRLHASNTFFAVNAVMLFVCFMALIWAHLQMGRNSGSPHTDGVRTRAWDAIFIAAAPVVIFSGLINWDLLAVALTALGLLAWARKRPIIAGLVIGLACAAKFYPLVLLAVLFLLCLRSAKMRAYFMMLGGAVVAWLAANLPVIITSEHGWTQFYTFNVDRGGDLGSIWYVFDLMGLRIPAVNVVETVLLFCCGAGIIVLTLRAPRRPRIGQIALLVMVAFLVFNKVYSPQYVLWLLPFVVLARPRILDLAVFTVSELAYYFAIWGFLDGVMGPGSGPDRLYWLSVALRVGVQIWIAVRVVDDVLHPWQDPVRGPYVDDPIGGVLDHAPDAPFMLAGRSGGYLAPAPVVAPRDAQRASRGADDAQTEASSGPPEDDVVAGLDDAVADLAAVDVEPGAAQASVLVPAGEDAAVGAPAVASGDAAAGDDVVPEGRQIEPASVNELVDATLDAPVAAAAGAPMEASADATSMPGAAVAAAEDAEPSVAMAQPDRTAVPGLEADEASQSGIAQAGAQGGVGVQGGAGAQGGAGSEPAPKPVASWADYEALMAGIDDILATDLPEVDVHDEGAAEAAPDATAPDVTAPDGAAPDVTTPDVTTPDVTTSDGAAPDRPVSDRAAPHWTVPDRPVSDRPAPDGAAPDGNSSATDRC